MLKTKEEPWPNYGSYVKTNSKCFGDLNVTDKTIKFLEENILENHHDLELGKVFIESTPKAWPIKEDKLKNWK